MSICVPVGWRPIPQKPTSSHQAMQKRRVTKMAATIMIASGKMEKGHTSFRVAPHNAVTATELDAYLLSRSLRRFRN